MCYWQCIHKCDNAVSQLFSYGGMSVVCVQASALDVGSDVTELRYSFFQILELILQSCNHT